MKSESPLSIEILNRTVSRLRTASVAESDLQEQLGYFAEILSELPTLQGVALFTIDRETLKCFTATGTLESTPLEDVRQLVLPQLYSGRPFSDSGPTIELAFTEGFKTAKGTLTVIPFSQDGQRAGALIYDSTLSQDRATFNASFGLLVEIIAERIKSFQLQEEIWIHKNSSTMRSEALRIAHKYLTSENPVDLPIVAREVYETFSCRLVSIWITEYRRTYHCSTLLDNRSWTACGEESEILTSLRSVAESAISKLIGSTSGKSGFLNGPQIVRDVEFPGNRPRLELTCFGLRYQALGDCDASSSQPRIKGVMLLSQSPNRGELEPDSVEALQRLCDLLAVTITKDSKMLTQNLIWRAHEAIAISRYESDAGNDSDPGPKLVDWNQRANEIFGYPDDVIEGMPAKYPHAEEYDVLRQSLGQKNPTTGPLRLNIRNARGNTTPIDATFWPHTSPFADPKVHYTLSLLRDRSEAADKEDHLNRLVELMNERGLAYFRANSDGFTIQTSQAECRITGYNKTELEGMPRSELYWDSHKRGDLIGKVRAKNGRLVETTQRLKTKEGKPFVTKGVIRLIIDDQGHRAGFEGMYEDVSDRIQLQGFLDLTSDVVLEDQELHQRIRENNQFFLDYMTSLGHQIRTPLTTLSHNLKNLRQNIDSPEEFKQQLPYIEGQTKVANHLAANLSFIDRILRGEKFDFQPVNLARLVIEAKLDFEHLYKKRRLSIKVEAESIDKILPRVQGHIDLLRQVVFNLLDNAVKYSFPNSQIQIRANLGVYQGILEFSNIGPAIASGDRERLFERQFRAPTTAALVPEGTGLGLWLVRKIVQIHDAEISCQTKRITEQKHEYFFQISFPSYLIGEKPKSRRPKLDPESGS